MTKYEKKIKDMMVWFGHLEKTVIYKQALYCT